MLEEAKLRFALHL
jgi:hypothetical protein